MCVCVCVCVDWPNKGPSCTLSVIPIVELSMESTNHNQGLSQQTLTNGILTLTKNQGLRFQVELSALPWTQNPIISTAQGKEPREIYLLPLEMVKKTKNSRSSGVLFLSGCPEIRSFLQFHHFQQICLKKKKKFSQVKFKDLIGFVQ